MAYYYYYQQPHTQSGSMSPVSMASELTSPLTPLLLLSPQHQQQQLTLPLLTPVMPSVTTSLPMTTTATIEHNQQQQLPTPNTFIRHCEDMGLFHDLQNIVVMPSLTGPADTTTTTVPVTTTSTMITTTSKELLINNSSLFGLSSTTLLTPMMMANPFDETFKQAVLQQQKSDSKLSENLSSNINNTDGDLNTPFISTTTIVNTSNYNTTLTMAALPVDMNTTSVVAAPITVESMRTNTTTVPQLQHQKDVFITTPATESTIRNVLVMMVEQQQQFITPTTLTTTSGIDTTTITSHDRDCSDSEARKKANRDENETSTIKQTLKQSLLEKRQLQKQQKHPLILARRHDPEQMQVLNFDTDVVATNTAIKDIQDNDKHSKQFQQKHKQELLERNRTAAKRCRIKRKQRWELLSEENRRLKIENKRLHDILAKLISREYGNQHQTASLQVQQFQINKHQAINKKKTLALTKKYL